MKSASYGGGVVFVKQMIVILSPSLPYFTPLPLFKLREMNYGSD